MSTESIAICIAGFGAIIAIWGVITQRALARRRATIDHISKLLNDHDYIRARLKFVQAAKTPTGLLPYAERQFQYDDNATADDKKQISELQSAITLVLNNYELMAIGLQRGILDYVILRRYARAIIIVHWHAASPYIARLRIARDNEKLYSELETLKNWMDGTKKKPNGRFWSLWF